MSNAGERRMKKRAQRLKSLVKSNRESFLQEWGLLVKGWLCEIHQRGRALREGIHCKQQGLSILVSKLSEDCERVFGVVENAKRLLRACGEEVEHLVGAETLTTLTHECSKVVSCALNMEMYRLINHRYYHKERIYK
jgi:hypothetical protein